MQRMIFHWMALGMALFGCTASGTQETQNQEEMKDSATFFIGTYTGTDENSSKGIYRINQNKNDGSLSDAILVAELTNPTFLAISPDKNYLYAVSEVGGDGSTIHSYKIQSDLSLKKLNHQPTLGNSACHVLIDNNQTMAFVANYSSGVATVYHIHDDGSLSEPVQHFQYEGSGPHPNQDRSHPHQTALSPDGKYAFISDLGLDRIHIYRIDEASKKLIPHTTEAVKLSPGSGPRHLTFHPHHPYAYVINELNNTIQAFHYEEDTGLLIKKDVYSTLPLEFDGISYCADIHISADGKYLYGSNRGHNSIAIFQIDSSDGTLELTDIQTVHGDWPRNFHITRDDQYLYAGNQNSGNISIFKRNTENGSLSLIDSSFTDTFSPVCVIDY